MKTKNISLAALFLLAVIFLYHQAARPAAVLSTPRAIAVQKYLKAVIRTTSMDAARPAISGKIPIVDFNDKLFHKELVQLARNMAFYYWLHPDWYGVTGLTPRQRAEIARVTAVAGLSRKIYEAEIATVDDRDQTAIKIAIPAYDDSSLHDYLVNQITNITNDPVLAQSLAGDIRRDPGAYPQNIDMTQKTIAGNNGEPVVIVSLMDHTMIYAPALGVAIQSGADSSFIRDQMGVYAPFAAFLK
jgi:hypothetical protein